MRPAGGLFLALVVVAATGCSVTGRAPVDAAPSERPQAWDWEKVAPGSVGLDAAALDRLADKAEKGRSNCLAVVRDGKLAGEWYFRQGRPDAGQEVFSVTKSVASLLVGIAQDDGALRIDDRASTWITEWQGTPSEKVTVRDLLSNASGREWSTGSDYGRLIFARDRTSYAIGLKQARPPGTVWAYNNAAIQTLDRVLRGATGQDAMSFARTRLFEPLGMTRTMLTKDRSGNPQLFMGMLSTCRDLARLGQLMLNQGQWGGRRIVSAEWVKASTGRPSTKLNDAYGYLWWLNKRGTVVGPLAATGARDDGGARRSADSIAPGAPDSVFWALGLGNQLVQVDPGSRTVVVRLGPGGRPRPPTFGPADAAGVLRAIVR
ncbi:serine hydrolase domain-containing protein [Actinomadura sp. SCN-SB]|uniref:serine hydrolase domain-containing protein n=1 Tax=Actinomadura sp. SCN-SB TaxID=3373092 RepID=UPI0037511853